MSHCHTASNYGECSRCVRQWKLGSGGRCCRPCRFDAPCLHPDAWGNMRFIQRSLISRFQNVFESLWDFRRVMDCDWDWWCCRKEGEYVQIKTFLFSLSMFLNIQMRLKDKSHKSMVVFTYAFSLAQCIQTFESVVSVILKWCFNEILMTEIQSFFCTTIKQWFSNVFYCVPFLKLKKQVDLTNLLSLNLMKSCNSFVWTKNTPLFT